AGRFTPPPPLLGSIGAYTRGPREVTPGHGDTPVFLPGERIGLADALTAYTAGSAYVNHLDDTGEVRAGALADLVVLDRDPFDGAAGEIADTRVAVTYVGGARVYAAQEA
ncbi:amidohydrolase family protein, partial [Streptomyces sp. NPDC058605]|uniref:amidohydrolase family protein n=1 Tax=Streptomyces sp. NPDC058605 TaxID=3346552 RepID=UPI00364B23A8